MSDELEKAYKKRGAWRAEKYLPPALAHHSLLIYSSLITISIDLPVAAETNELSRCVRARIV